MKEGHVEKVYDEGEARVVVEVEKVCQIGVVREYRMAGDLFL